MFGWLNKLASRFATRRSTAHLARLRAKYDAAQNTADYRRHWANADALSAAACNSQEVRRTLRNRARYECANNCYARGMLLTMANDLIGTGPRLQLSSNQLEEQAQQDALKAKIEQARAFRRVEREFAKWAKAVRLAEKLRTMCNAKVQDGEAFALLTTNEALPTRVKLDIRLVECDQIASPQGMPNSSDVVDGIRFDSAGNPTAYYMLRNHPGSGLPGADGEWKEAKDVLHWFRCDRPGQVRGIPDLTPALPLFADLRRYTLAVIAAADTAAEHAGVLQTDAPPEGNALVDPFLEIEINRRMLTTVPAGWELKQLDAKQPTTSYGEFKGEILDELGRCVNMPSNVVRLNSSKYNYASGRLDQQTHGRTVVVDRDQIDACLLDRIFAAWLDEAALIPGLLPEGLGLIADWDHAWMWPGSEHVDPEKEANAEGTRLDNHTDTLQDIWAEKGFDWREKLQQRGEEISFQRDLKIPVKGEGSPPANQPNDPSKKPANDSNSDANDNEDSNALQDAA